MLMLKPHLLMRPLLLLKRQAKLLRSKNPLSNLKLKTALLLKKAVRLLRKHLMINQKLRLRQLQQISVFQQRTKQGIASHATLNIIGVLLQKGKVLPSVKSLLSTTDHSAQVNGLSVGTSNVKMVHSPDPCSIAQREPCCCHNSSITAEDYRKYLFFGESFSHK